MNTPRKANRPASPKERRTPPLGDLVLSPSERLIMSIVRRLGPVARSAIAAETDLAQQSVHRLVEQLIERGLLRAGDAVRSGRGQPSPQIDIVRDAAYAVGVSINTDSIILCLADLGCEVLDEVRLRTAPLHRQASLKSIHDVLQRVLARNGVPRDRIIGMGVAISGFFVAGRRQVNAPEPLRDWSLIDLAPILEEAFHMPVWLENDATTAAIGESMLGTGSWAKNFAYLAFNFGFGAGIVLDGKPLFGTHGNAGELTLFTPDEAAHRPTLCSLIDELNAHGVHVDSAEDLRRRFDIQWPGVELWIQRTLPALNRTINAVTGLFDPAAIVFGGQLPLALGHALIERVSFLDIHRYGAGPDRPKLVLAEANGDASAIGAAVIPLKERLFE
ncbi:MAG TPA: ROK family transcriptional regulator [Luteibacter sp.]|uniref:ROK family transcriptional regulator n=1 Tax=Luteibacter sp. TaxID=1886636 RepID=UPI002F3F57D7